MTLFKDVRIDVKDKTRQKETGFVPVSFCLV